MIAALLLSMLALTQPHPEQIRNIEQIRICRGCGDDRPGTLILQSQLYDGRSVHISDEGLPTICVVWYLRFAVDPPTWLPHNTKQNVCYKQAGLAKLLEDPAWLAWWNVHKNDAGAATSTGAELIRQILTHPRPVP